MASPYMGRAIIDGTVLCLVCKYLVMLFGQLALELFLVFFVIVYEIHYL